RALQDIAEQGPGLCQVLLSPQVRYAVRDVIDEFEEQIGFLLFESIRPAGVYDQAAENPAAGPQRQRYRRSAIRTVDHVMHRGWAGIGITRDGGLTRADGQSDQPLPALGIVPRGVVWLRRF